MRVIGGELGGRTIKSHERAGLRPTTDRVREAMFNILASRIEFDSIHVLDLYAGTGALGIEALSRGASHCTFVESDRRASSLIAENLAALELEGRSLVIVRDALKFVGETHETFDLIVADPPYASTQFDQLVHELFARSIVREHGLLLLEHSSTMRPRTVDGARLLVHREIGDTAVSLFCVERPSTGD